MLRFSLFGFPIAVHWMFWVNTALLGGGLNASTPRQMQMLLLWVAAAFLSVLIHELGHTFMQRRFGARAQILLYAFGGLAIPDRAFRRGQDIVVSLAGPIVQIAVGVGARLLLGQSTGDAWPVQVFLDSFATVSIFWGVLNLAPIHPLDGGHVLLGVLGPRNARIAFITGMFCAVALAVWMGTMGSIFSTIFFGMLAYENFQRSRGIDSGSVLHPQ